MNKNMLRSIPKRFFALILTAILFAGLAGIAGMTGNRGVIAADDTYSFSNGGSNANATVTGPEGSVAVQFNVKAAFKSVSLVLSGSGSGKTATMKLYKWNQNVIDSVKGPVLAEKEIKEWNGGDEIVLETSQEAGEYVRDKPARDRFGENESNG